MLGAGNLEAEGLAIEENFGMPEDFNGVAEVEGSIVAKPKAFMGSRRGGDNQ